MHLPGLLLTSLAGSAGKNLNVLLDKQLSSLLKEDGIYIQLGEKNDGFHGAIAQPYAIYTRRT